MDLAGLEAGASGRKGHPPLGRPYSQLTILRDKLETSVEEYKQYIAQRQELSDAQLEDTLRKELDLHISNTGKTVQAVNDSFKELEKCFSTDDSEQWIKLNGMSTTAEGRKSGGNFDHLTGRGGGRACRQSGEAGDAASLSVIPERRRIEQRFSERVNRSARGVQGVRPPPRWYIFRSSAQLHTYLYVSNHTHVVVCAGTSSPRRQHNCNP